MITGHVILIIAFCFKALLAFVASEIRVLEVIFIVSCQTFSRGNRFSANAINLWHTFVESPRVN